MYHFLLSFHFLLSRTQVLLTKISQTCQSIRDIKKVRKQLVFHRTSNTLRGTTSCSNPPDHSNPHSSTSDGRACDDNAKKSSSSTSSSLGAHTILTAQHIVIPHCLLLSQHRLPDCHHQMDVPTLLHLPMKKALHLHPKTLGRIPGSTVLPLVRRPPPALATRSSASLLRT